MALTRRITIVAASVVSAPGVLLAVAACLYILYSIATEEWYRAWFVSYGTKMAALYLAFVVGVIAIALGVGWLMGRVVNREVKPSPRWKFGEGDFERVAFPLFASIFLLVAKAILSRFQPVALVSIAQSLMVALRRRRSPPRRIWRTVWRLRLAMRANSSWFQPRSSTRRLIFRASSALTEGVSSMSNDVTRGGRC